MSTIDFRSDTVTRPTPSMYAAITTAALGDDVLGDEPTVAKLEEVAAAKVGKEAAMFVPSGTMGNLCAVASWTSPGEAVIIEEEAHVLYYEAAGSAVIAGAMFRSVPSDGVMKPEEVEARITSQNIHTPGTTLICLENTHNRKGGAIIPVEVHREYHEIAQKHGLHVHLDGARVFNAAVALGVDVREITQHVDSVNFCLSKGLASPVGSVLCGPSTFIDRARQWRKRVGGGMRQAGILAACGLVSLNEMVERLAEDHHNASRLSQALSLLPGLHPAPCPTNILMVDTDRPAEEWQSALDEAGIACFAVKANRLRLVLHKDVDSAQVDQAVSVFRKLALELA